MGGGQSSTIRMLREQNAASDADRKAAQAAMLAQIEKNRQELLEAEERQQKRVDAEKQLLMERMKQDQQRADEQSKAQQEAYESQRGEYREREDTQNQKFDVATAQHRQEIKIQTEKHDREIVTLKNEKNEAVEKIQGRLDDEHKARHEDMDRAHQAMLEQMDNSKKELLASERANHERILGMQVKLMLSEAEKHKAITGIYVATANGQAALVLAKEEQSKYDALEVVIQAIMNSGIEISTMCENKMLFEVLQIKHDQSPSSDVEDKIREIKNAKIEYQKDVHKVQMAFRTASFPKDEQFVKFQNAINELNKTYLKNFTNSLMLFESAVRSKKDLKLAADKLYSAGLDLVEIIAELDPPLKKDIADGFKEKMRLLAADVPLQVQQSMLAVNKLALGEQAALIGLEHGPETISTATDASVCEEQLVVVE